MSQSYENIWEQFKDSKYDFEALSDEQVGIVTKHYMKEWLHQMTSPERMQVFMAEMNARSATQIARVGKCLTIVSTIIAGVALIVGVVQVVITLKHC